MSQILWGSGGLITPATIYVKAVIPAEAGIHGNSGTDFKSVPEEELDSVSSTE